jgi:predicted alpha/beta-hydrolase family hydrolase
MKTIIFPGYSQRNKNWVLTTAQELKLDHEIRPILWKHWEDNRKEFKVDEKAKAALKVIGQAKINIVAKSIGILVTMVLINQVREEINKVILCGLPLQLAEKRQSEFAKALKDFPTDKIIVFQNVKDPLGSFERVKKFFNLVNPKIKLKKMPRSDHNYPYFAEFQRFLE